MDKLKPCMGICLPLMWYLLLGAGVFSGASLFSRHLLLSVVCRGDWSCAMSASQCVLEVVAAWSRFRGALIDMRMPPDSTLTGSC
jgi:hypothetical protein